MQRIATLEPPYDDEATAAIEALGPPIALFRLLARRPDRAHGMHGWGRYYLSRRCALKLRHREMAVLRTTALCGAEYEWGVHVEVFADRAGLTSEQVTSLTIGSVRDRCWPEADDRAVLQAVDALHRNNDLTDTEWTNVHGSLGDEAVIDLLLLCGWYHAISFVTRATRLPLEPTAPTFPDTAGATQRPVES